jgi:hypothetical protein
MILFEIIAVLLQSSVRYDSTFLRNVSTYLSAYKALYSRRRFFKLSAIDREPQKFHFLFRFSLHPDLHFILRILPSCRFAFLYPLFFTSLFASIFPVFLHFFVPFYIKLHCELSNGKWIADHENGIGNVCREQPWVVWKTSPAIIG